MGLVSLPFHSIIIISTDCEYCIPFPQSSICHGRQKGKEKRKSIKSHGKAEERLELIKIVDISNQSKTFGLASLGQCHARRRHHLRLLDPLSDPLLHQHLQRAEIRRHDDQRLHCCGKTLQCQCDPDSGVSTESDCSCGTWRSSCKCSRKKKTPLVGGKEKILASDRVLSITVGSVVYLPLFLGLDEYLSHNRICGMSFFLQCLKKAKEKKTKKKSAGSVMDWTTNNLIHHNSCATTAAVPGKSQSPVSPVVTSNTTIPTSRS